MSKHAPADGATPPFRLLCSDQDLRQAIDILRQSDPLPIGVLFDAVGYPPLRRQAGGFAGLASVIVAQKISTASAAAVFARLVVAVDPFTPATILAADEATLRHVGLPGAKIQSLRAVAEALRAGTLCFDRLAALPADAAHAELVAVRGIGPWTADIFLLFSLGEADAWPAGDLAIQEVVRLLFALPKRPDARAVLALAERWRPYRGVAAHLMWAYYLAAPRRGLPNLRRERDASSPHGGE